IRVHTRQRTPQLQRPPKRAHLLKHTPQPRRLRPHPPAPPPPTSPMWSRVLVRASTGRQGVDSHGAILSLRDRPTTNLRPLILDNSKLLNTCIAQVSASTFRPTPASRAFPQTLGVRPMAWCETARCALCKA